MKTLQKEFPRQGKFKRILISIIAEKFVLVMLVLGMLLVLELCLRYFSSDMLSMSFESFGIPFLIRSIYALMIIFLANLQRVACRYAYIKESEKNYVYKKVKKYFWYSTFFLFMDVLAVAFLYFM